MVFRFRHEAERFADAFEVFPASEYENENEVATIISCGPETAEALRAAYILKREFDIESRVLHFHTIKPLDNGAIVRAAGETGCVVTAEEHQVGGLGFRVAAVMAEKWASMVAPSRFTMIGIPDRFGESGKPWQLMRHFGLTAEYIAVKVKELLREDQ